MKRMDPSLQGSIRIDLANEIMWVLKDAERWKFFSRTARKTAEREYDISIIAKRYAELYQTIVT